MWCGDVSLEGPKRGEAVKRVERRDSGNGPRYTGKRARALKRVRPWTAELQAQQPKKRC